MTETAITTAMITIACVVSASLLVSAIFPALHRASSSVVSSSTLLGERIETSIDIIAETNDTTQAYIYVKNIGASGITQIDYSDIFFGKTNNFQRIPYDASLSATPSWSYVIENDGGNGQWDGGETVNVTVKTAGITSGDYFVKMILHNGISAEDTYSI